MSRRRKLPRWFAITASAVGTLGLAELAVRLSTTGPEGTIRRVFGVAILPFTFSTDVADAWVAEDRSDGYLRPDPELGWTIGPGFEMAGIEYSSDARGARLGSGQRDEGAVRLTIVTVGDSFTHGDEVENDETWQAAMERDDPGVSVVNFGVPGYGTDQAVLRWERESAVAPHQVALLGIWPDNIFRNLNVLRPRLHLSLGPSVKPRFVLAGDGIDIRNQPIASLDDLAAALSGEEPAFLDDEYWQRDWETAAAWRSAPRLARFIGGCASAFLRRQERTAIYRGDDRDPIELTARICQRFHDRAVARGIRPVVVLLPMLELLDDYPDDGSLPLVAEIRDRGIEAIDLSDAFAAAVADGGAPVYLPSGHLAPDGNELVARTLLERLFR